MEASKSDSRVEVPQSKRPISFTSLPLELRLGIYRHSILIDQSVQAQSPAYLMFHGLEAAEIKKRSCPGILRVSRAIYEEASAIYYGENVFQYHCQANDRGALSSFESGYSKICSAKIKHVELFCHQDSTKLTAECVSTMLESLKSIGYCSLKTLRLKFDLECTYQPSEVFQEVLSKSIVDSAFERYRILSCIQALQVQQKIEVHLTTDLKGDGQGYEYLVNAIAARMGWKSERITASMGWEVGLRDHESHPSVHTMAHLTIAKHKWGWVLQPDSGAK